MFALDTKLKFKTKADTDVIAKVASAIMATDEPIPSLKKK